MVVLAEVAVGKHKDQHYMLSKLKSGMNDRHILNN